MRGKFIGTDAMEMNAADMDPENAPETTAWEQRLAEVRRNNESVTTFYIQFDDENVIRRYGESLGKALQHNTNVTELTLDVTKLTEGYAGEQIPSRNWTALLSHVENSAALHSVFLEASSYVDDIQHPKVLFTTKLLRTVGKNANVRKFSIDWMMNYDPDEMASFLNHTTSVDQPTIK
jgi:hypothetical protein